MKLWERVGNKMFGFVQNTYTTKTSGPNKKPLRSMPFYNFSGLTRVQSNLDEEIDSMLSLVSGLVIQGEVVVRKDGELVSDKLSQALKYHPTNSESFTEFLSQMFRYYKLYGVAYARIHREDGLLGRKGFKRFEILNPWNVQMLKDDDYDVTYFYLIDKDELLDKTEVMWVKSSSKNKEEPNTLKDLTQESRRQSEKIEQSLAVELAKNSKFNYYVDITNTVANPMLDEGYQYMTAVQKLYQTLQDNGSGPLMNHEDIGEIKEFKQYKASSTNAGVNYKDLRQVYKETAARFLGLPLAIFNPAIDPDQSRYYEILKQTIIPFYIQIEEAMDSALFTMAERVEGYRTRIESPEVFVARNKELGQMTTPLSRNGVYTINESRQLFNKKPLKGGDILTISADLINVQDAVNNDQKSGVEPEPTG